MEFRYGDPVHDPAVAPKTPRPQFSPQCLTCGYDLRGLPPGRCPECGNAFEYREWERAVRDAKSSIAHVEDLLRYVPWSWKLVLIGVGLMLGGLIPGISPTIKDLLRVTALICGGVGFLLALNILRVRRVPLWARAHMTRQPDYSGALVGILGGAAVAVGSMLLP